MKYLINDVICDAYTHLDKKKASETLMISVSEPISTIIVYLCCNSNAFPISSAMKMVPSCCVTDEFGVRSFVQCSIGEKGEIIINIPVEVYPIGAHLHFEIRIIGEDRKSKFAYTASEFCAVIIP